VVTPQRLRWYRTWHTQKIQGVVGKSESKRHLKGIRAVGKIILK